MDRQVETRPPALAEAVVRALVPPASREHVLGDLHERYTSPRHYVLDALSTLPFVVASRIRRTTHPIGFVFAVAFLWFAVFYGPFQKSWITALIPSLAGAVVLALRDAYRTLTPRWAREAFIDVTAFALSVALSQAVVALAAPQFLLAVPALVMGVPIGCVVLFLVRLQMPGGVTRPRMPGEMSLPNLRLAVRAYEAAIRRAVRAEIAAAFLVIVGFSVFAALAPTWVARIGCALSALGGAFVGWYLERRARVVPIPDGLDFTQLAAAYRDDIESRARMLRTSFWWYILPLAIGPTVLMIGPGVLGPVPLLKVLPVPLGVVILAGVIRVLHRAGAKKSDELARQVAGLKETPC